MYISYWKFNGLVNGFRTFRPEKPKLFGRKTGNWKTQKKYSTAKKVQSKSFQYRTLLETE